MWPFKRKKQSQSTDSGLPCTYCGSRDTIVTLYNGSDQPSCAKTWRGQRYITCRCLNCKQDFYANEPQSGLDESVLSSDNAIEDEDALRDAEDEIKRQIDEDGDRRYKPNDNK